MKKTILLSIIFIVLSTLVYSQSATAERISPNPESSIDSSKQDFNKRNSDGPQTPWHALSEVGKRIYLDAFIEGVFNSAKLAYEVEPYVSRETSIYYERVKILYDKIKNGDIEKIIERIDVYFGWYDGKDFDFGHVMLGAVQSAVGSWLFKVG